MGRAGLLQDVWAQIMFFFGKIEDSYGAKWCIEISIITLFFAVLLAFIAPYFNNILIGKSIFWFSGILIGIMTGPSQSCSRSLMARLTPEEKTNEFFGFYAFTGKATAFLGPFLFALLSVYSPQIGLLVVVLFFLIGYVIFKPLNINPHE